MPDLELTTTLTQFGMAGLIAWMWLTERHAASGRERQLTEAHERIVDQRVQLDALLTVISENTRAVAAVESGQRALSLLVERLGADRAAPDFPGIRGPAGATAKVP